MTRTTIGILKNESEKATLYLYNITKSPAGDVETEVGALAPGESHTKDLKDQGMLRIKAEENGTRVTILELERDGISESTTRQVGEVKGVKIIASLSTHYN
ncbi:hypothetical protein APHAL10511_000558 [Amanita phalloides]|nr:hypothetical protein APHAL10511_000558 [Amanita phalloides]